MPEETKVMEIQPLDLGDLKKNLNHLEKEVKKTLSLIQDVKKKLEDVEEKGLTLKF